jgi:hypothetical protein
MVTYRSLRARRCRCRIGRACCATKINPLQAKPAVQGYIQLRAITGNQCSISLAREPDSASAPAPFASATDNSPAASSSQVRGSVSTTLGGVPRVCRGPATHCTATNGGTRTSTLAPGASAASVRAVSRTAFAKASRSGAGWDPSRNQSATASMACRVFAGSALSRAGIPAIRRCAAALPPTSRAVPPGAR